MSDGTTGIQVAPIPTESEMAKIREIFTNVANALVRASELAKQVEDLEGRFKSLSEDHNRVMARSDQLDQSLVEARHQRDEANSKLTETTHNLNDAKHEINMLTNQATSNGEEISRLKAELEATKKGWDEACIEASNEHKRADAAEAKLKAIHKTLGIPEAPEPKPEPQLQPDAPTPTPSEPTQPVVNPEPRPLSEEEAKPHQDEGDKPSYAYQPSNRW